MKIFILQLCLFKCLLWIDLIHAQLPTCQPVSSLSLKEKWILSVYYRPQRSWAKVIFSQASVCPRGGGVSASVHAGICTLEQTPNPLSRPPGSRHPPRSRPAYGQRAAGMHPTGMHSCCRYMHAHHVLAVFSKCLFSWTTS